MSARKDNRCKNKRVRLPRLAVAGLRGDAGKTLVALGIVRALYRRGRKVAPFKKGPDYIDAGWLGQAAGREGRNLDTFLMAPEVVCASLARAAETCELAVIEGNRGLLDGLDAEGTHSTAALCRLTRTPAVLVLDAGKATRTLAAPVLGCRQLEPELDLAGVILNRVATARQETLIRQVLRDTCGLEVLGAVPPLRADLPGRHLGLVTADEHPAADGLLDELAELMGRYMALDDLLAVAERAGDLPAAPPPAEPIPARVTIGVLRDPAFSFYYPENLEALCAAGARLVGIHPRQDGRLPALDGLYAGGGFPELHAEALSANAELRERLRRAIAEGLPTWAECGGLMYLAEAIECGQTAYPMVGALPIRVRQTERPQGHGYVEARVEGENPFLPLGTNLRGHEFHYSRLCGGEQLPAAWRLSRGTGTGGGRDALCLGSLQASYTHLHALSLPQWAGAMVAAAAGERRRQAAAAEAS